MATMTALPKSTCLVFLLLALVGCDPANAIRNEAESIAGQELIDCLGATRQHPDRLTDDACVSDAVEGLLPHEYWGSPPAPGSEDIRYTGTISVFVEADLLLWYLTDNRDTDPGGGLLVARCSIASVATASVEDQVCPVRC